MDFSGAFMTAMVQGLNPMNGIMAQFAQGQVSTMQVQTETSKKNLIDSYELQIDELQSQLAKAIADNAPVEILKVLKDRIAAKQARIDRIDKL